MSSGAGGAGGEGGVQWSRLKCAADAQEHVAEGRQERARFPWLGVLQHSFYLAGKERHAVTAAVLVHPGWLLAAAEDVAKILPEQMLNNTKFIVWLGAGERVSLDVRDYVLHPEYQEAQTSATVALLQLEDWFLAKRVAPVLPICLPVKGAGSFSELYTVRITDDSGEIEKEALAMNYVPDADCNEFYYRAQLTYKKMAPTQALCAASRARRGACVWPAGALLVARPRYGYWTLLGFGVRGPGCGAPARFVAARRELAWLADVVAPPARDRDPGHKFFLRQISPLKLIMYRADVKVPTHQGQCERQERGGVIYKESDEVLMNKNFGQGFYFVEVYQMAQFRCAVVQLQCTMRTNAAVWLEHHCHNDLTGLAYGMKGTDFRRMECFVYFKSTAFIEFRFFFSFKATIEVTLYGFREEPPFYPNPFPSSETTDPWYPTRVYLDFGKFTYIGGWVWWY